MTLDEMDRQLVAIQGRLSDLLDQDGRAAIRLCRKQLESQRAAWEEEWRARSKVKLAERTPWKLEIPRGQPLSFIQTRLKGDLRWRIHVDLSCQITQVEEGVPLGKHDIILRMWSDEENAWFRPEFDAEALRARISAVGRRRVMFRCHFDYSAGPHAGPHHHVQIGGSAGLEEFSWFPGNLRHPRFAHHPMSLLMVCEFVARTFFPDEFKAVEEEPSWVHGLRVAQREYLPPYFRRQKTKHDDETLDASLLARLWNSPAPA